MKKAVAWCLAVVVLAGAVWLALPGKAFAMRPNEVEYEYFSEPQKINMVGYRMYPCVGGSFGWGDVTAYYNRYQEKCKEFREPTWP
jgi:hypothetical protein